MREVVNDRENRFGALDMKLGSELRARKQIAADTSQTGNLNFGEQVGAACGAQEARGPGHYELRWLTANKYHCISAEHGIRRICSGVRNLAVMAMAVELCDWLSQQG
ncbi:MAG TPA: hypothetical protein VEB21_13185 [Terriglobales bacterium]|nr:hypothetical protein [Terriglobales bacterium]